MLTFLTPSVAGMPSRPVEFWAGHPVPLDVLVVRRHHRGRASEYCPSQVGAPWPCGVSPASHSTGHENSPFLSLCALGGDPLPLFP